jgi:hypothetical protein
VALTVILVVAMLKQRKGFRPRRKTALGSGAEMVVWAWRVKSVAVAAVVAGGCGVACMAVCRWQAVAVWRSHMAMGHDCEVRPTDCGPGFLSNDR